jgi:acetyl-CoA carboxylase biotin carboxylase subunit
VEEAPAPNISETLREEMQRAAVALARHLNYRGVGTVEFLVDCDRDTFYFLEMNARIQVEHPVTEVICGIDLVEEQIRVAESRTLRWKQDEIRFTGHAIECRINAEDCEHDFLPSPGTVTRAVFAAGQGIRVDTHIQAGAMVPPLYDSLLGKLIVHGKDRPEALQLMRSALAIVEIDGVITNVAMHAALMNNNEFANGGVNTSFFPRFLQNGKKEAA